MANKDLDLKIVINAQDKSGPALGKVRGGIESVNQQLASMNTRFQQLLSLKIGEIIGNQLKKVIDTADGFKTLQARLKLVSDTTAEYVTAQKAVFEIAQRTRSSLEATAAVYGKVETVVKQLGGTQQDAIGVTETLNQAIALTSQGAANDAAAILQFSQALGSGVLRGDEFNSVMENSPGLAQALANGLQVPITALRGMAEAGELTADKLINALGKAAPEVASQFAQLPVTVGQAFTQLNNEFTRYIGEADAAGGATAKLSASIQFAAENFKPLAETALTLAGVYGVTLLQGLIKSAAAMVDNAAAARAQAVAQQTSRIAAVELLQVELQVAKVRAITARQLIEEARLQQALAVTDKQRAASIKMVEKAFLEYHNAVNLVNSKQAALQAATTKTAAALTLAQRAAAGLNAALNIFLAFEIGRTIGEWLNQFDLVRKAGARLAQTFTIAAAAAEAAFGGAKLKDLPSKISKINATYDDMVSRIGAVEEAEKARAEVTKSATELAVKNLKAEVDAYKALADAAKESSQQQLSRVDDQQKLQIRRVETTVTDGDGVNRERERQRQITEILERSAQERSRISEQAAKEQIALMDLAHAKEVEAAKKSNQSTKAIDKSWLDSKYKVLQDWQSSSRKTIDELIALEKKHRDAAVQSDKEIADHRRSTAQLINELQGKSDANNSVDLNKLRNNAYAQKREITQARKSGDIDAELEAAKRVEQTYINIAELAKGLLNQGAIDTSTFDIVLFDLKKAAEEVDRITERKSEKQKQTAEEVAVEISKQQATLADVNTLMDGLIEKAKQTLTIYVDQTAIYDAKAAIDAIPTEKTITVKVVDENGQAVKPIIDDTQTIDNTETVPGYASGTRLSGFGGGDRHPALLESGEGVVNKYGMLALDKSFGPGFFDGINAGVNPIDLLRGSLRTLKLSEGGRVSNNSGGASGTPVNIYLPDGRSFGPFISSDDSAKVLAEELSREVLKRGNRV